MLSSSQLTWISLYFLAMSLACLQWHGVLMETGCHDFLLLLLVSDFIETPSGFSLTDILGVMPIPDVAEAKAKYLKL